MDGILVIDKPSGLTSHDVVSRVRRRFHMRRVGHAGTLDPLATGVLVILLGKATKLFSKFETFDKAYMANLLLGTQTNTSDIEGTVVRQRPFTHIRQDQLEKVLEKFRGEIKQIPPMVSAIKVNGKKLYELAREGKEIPRQARNVRIDKLQLIEFVVPDVKIYLECSKGTYVRQLADDIGEQLGCGACITQIRRTAVGPFSLDEAVPIEHMDEKLVQSPEAFLETVFSLAKGLR